MHARDSQLRAAILRQAVSISLAVTPFGIAFGVLAAEAGLTIWQAIGFSSLVFTGSAQFAAVSVLAEGGTVAAAVIAGVLLNLRCVAFGVVMAPSLEGSLPWRLAVSQMMIDESTAIGSAQVNHRWQRFGYIAGGIGVAAGMVAGRSPDRERRSCRLWWWWLWPRRRRPRLEHSLEI